MKAEQVKSRNPKSTDRPKITLRRSRSRSRSRSLSLSLSGSTRFPITLIIINRGGHFVAKFTSIKTLLPISISDRTAIRADTGKDSVRAVNDDLIQATEEAIIRLNIAEQFLDQIVSSYLQHSNEL
ncbi:hypothetical protein ACTXT7_001047 [Hymenolepis weldensis]